MQRRRVAVIIGMLLVATTLVSCVGKKVYPVPPPPVPPLDAPRQFIIFFHRQCDFADESELTKLTPEAKLVLDEAAVSIKSGGYAAKLVGHTDTIGTEQANQKLGEKRAEAAKAYLVSPHGVPATDLTTESKGEGDTLVNTGDNVCETQNNRVKIDLRISG